MRFLGTRSSEGTPDFMQSLRRDRSLMLPGPDAENAGIKETNRTSLIKSSSSQDLRNVKAETHMQIT
jgi:hypothetical protein